MSPPPLSTQAVNLDIASASVVVKTEMFTKPEREKEPQTSLKT